MRNLIQNERLKLYKKASTWVMVGIVVALSVFSLSIQGIIQHIDFSSFVQDDEATATDWQQQYKAQIKSSYNLLQDDPSDTDAKANLECYQYMLDNNIDPSHWKYGLMMSYNDNLTSLYAYEADPKRYLEEWDATEADISKLKQTVAAQKRLIQTSDWQEYVRLKIEDVQNGVTEFRTAAEKQVEIDILNMYLDLNIPPITNEDTDFFSIDNTRTWQQQELENLKKNKLALLRNETDYGGVLTSAKRKQLNEEITLSVERLKTNTPPIESDSLYGLMESSLSATSLLTILLMVLAGGMIANEFSAGTIKLLLITPHKRRSVFWAKVVVLVEITLIATGALFVLQFLVSGLFGGFGNIGDTYLTPLFGNIVRVPYILVMLYKYLLFLLPVFAFGALALMLSAVSRKSAFAIAVSIMLMYGGEIVNSILAVVSNVFSLTGARFMLFTNTNLDAYFVSSQTSDELFDLSDIVSAPSSSLLFSIAILVVHIACFLWIARDSFCRRDVK